jgi:hypothetical protein
VDESSCLFQIRGENGGNNENVTDNDTERTSSGSVQTDEIMSKARLTRLSIVAVRRHVTNVEGVEKIIPNGTSESIEQWAKIMFADPATKQMDTSQQRAFEVIVSMYVPTFHDEAEQNEGADTIGTLQLTSRAAYAKLKKN